MSRTVAFVIALAAFAFVVPASSGNAQTASGYSQGSGKSAKRAQRRRPIRVRVYPRRIGGYSSYPYIASVGSSNPGAYPTSPGRYYGDPMVRQQSSFGPFDRGFFYDSGQFSPYGGWAPYYH
jgi:hypothetical protein